jgi:hypothetical protein
VPRKVADLSGRRFGRLIVLRRTGRTKYGNSLYLCRCDCGNDWVISSQSLVSGHTKSCGCLRSEVSAVTCKKLCGSKGRRVSKDKS